MPLKGPHPRHLCIASGPTTEIQGQHQVWRNRQIGPRTPSRTTGANPGCVSIAKHTCFHFSKNRVGCLPYPWPPPDCTHLLAKRSLIEAASPHCENMSGELHAVVTVSSEKALSARVTESVSSLLHQSSWTCCNKQSILISKI